MIVYVSIGNSDDKLSQAEWAEYFRLTATTLRQLADKVHGQWASEPASAWQNACWCIELDDQWVEPVKDALVSLAVEHRQDSIAFAEVKDTEFLGAHS